MRHMSRCLSSIGLIGRANGPHSRAITMRRFIDPGDSSVVDDHEQCGVRSRLKPQRTYIDTAIEVDTLGVHQKPAQLS